MKKAASDISVFEIFDAAFFVGFRHCRFSDAGLPVPQWDACNSRQAVGSPLYILQKNRTISCAVKILRNILSG